MFRDGDVLVGVAHAFVVAHGPECTPGRIIPRREKKIKDGLEAAQVFIAARDQLEVQDLEVGLITRSTGHKNEHTERTKTRSENQHTQRKHQHTAKTNTTTKRPPCVQTKYVRIGCYLTIYGLVAPNLALSPCPGSVC